MNKQEEVKPSETIRLILPPLTTLERLNPEALHSGGRTIFPTHESRLDSFYDALFITDSNGIILDANIRAVTFFKVKSIEKFRGIPVYYLFSGNYSQFMQAVRSHLEIHPFVVLEARALSFENTSFLAEIAVSNVRSGTGSYIFTIRDITERNDDLTKLKEANERLLLNDRDRMEFVSNVSHELRTPLTSMIYAVNNMLRGLCGPLPEKAIQYLERLQVDEKRLMTTINDILDLRQIENHTLVLHRTVVPLVALLRSVIDALSIQADAKNIKIETVLPDAEIFISADQQKIERVFFNIINNAVKFTGENGEIRVTAEIDKTGKNRCKIFVDDNGVGIPPEALPNISNRYFRVGEHVAGTGLGLAIVKEIVELHGGFFTPRSPVPRTNCGTQIELDFETCQGPEIIIVSAENSIIERFSSIITKLGCRVKVDTDGRFLSNLSAADGVPALFVIDGLLPMSVINEMICELREHQATAKIPVILIGANCADARIADFARMHVEVICSTCQNDNLQELISRLTIHI